LGGIYVPLRITSIFLPSTEYHLNVDIEIDEITEEHVGVISV